MANGTSAAVTEAARLDEIGFPEFTTKLITDVFDALVGANLRQTESFIELLSAVAKTLSAYVNDTKDDISGEELLQFLAKVVPPDDPESGEATKVEAGETLSAEDADTLNAALDVPGLTDANSQPVDNKVAAQGQLDQAKVDAITEAIARRLAANRYDLLKEMVKLGILRLVVENGTIETRLTFTTYGSTFYQQNTSSYNRSDFKFRARARTGGFISLWAKASASTAYTSTSVRIAKESNRDVSGSRVQIYGGVTINFKTDYQPLNQ